MEPTLEQIKDIHFIVCDLDGTLFHSDKTISSDSINYLIELQKKGYTLVLATGRYFYELEDYIQQLEMRKYGGIIASANGLEIYDLSTQETHFFQMIDNDFAKKIIHKAKKDNIISYVNYHDRYHIFASFPIVFFLIL